MSRSKKKRGCNPLIAVLIVGCVLLALLVAGLFIGKISMDKWLQGDGFQEWVTNEAAKKLHAKVDVKSLDWQGKKVSIDKISAHGYEEAQFAKFNINASRAHLKSLSNRTVTISDIEINQANIEISPNRLQRPKTQKPTTQTPDAAESLKIPGFLKRFVPNKVKLGDIIVGSASIQVMDDDGTPVATVANTNVQITPNLQQESADITIKKGKLTITDVPEVDLIKSTMRWQDNSLFIKDSGASIFGEGHVASEGEINFNTEEPEFDLDLSLSSINLKEVLPEKWKGRVSGTVKGDVKVKGPSENLIQTGTLYLDKGVIEGIKILQQIATFTKSDLLKRIVLNEAQSEFSKQGDTLKLRKINIHSNDLVKLHGNLDIEGDKITGVIQLGVTPKTFRLIPGVREKVFTESKEGMVWTPVRISGTTNKIKEDLSKRVIAAATSDLLPSELAEQLGGVLFGKKNTNQETDNGESSKNSGLLKGLIEGAIENNVNDDSDIGKAIKRFGPLFKGQ